MIILGIDPGIATVGFGVIEAESNHYSSVKYGVITTEAGLPLSERLELIFNDMNDLLEIFHPDAVSVEELFFNTNLTTGISVAHGRGVILLACRQHNISMYEYTPLQVKQTITGYGRADKKQMMEMVKRLLKLEQIPRPDDAADALALAMCHARFSSSLINFGSDNTCSTI